MFEEIDTTIQSVERLYRTVSGRDVPEGETAPLPPERDAVKHVEDQLEKLLATLNLVPRRPLESSAWAPPVTVLERPNELVFRVDLPGVPREDVVVSTNAVSVTVRGRRMPSADAGRLLNAEPAYGLFARQLALPPNANSQELTANLKDGVLELRVPRVGPSARPVTVQ